MFDHYSLLFRLPFIPEKNVFLPKIKALCHCDDGGR
jgi:hypothetical protein